MNTYFYTHIDRRDFGDLLSEAGLSRLRIRNAPKMERLESPRDNALLAVWLSDPLKTRKLPEVLICQDETQNDWAAWLTTYAAKIRPFSANMRLMTNSELQRGAKNLQVPELGELAWPAAGLILGEVLAASGLPDKSLETLSATAFASTLSFVVFRVAILYADFQDWGSLIQRWDSVREITKQRDRFIEGSSVARVCAIIMRALDINGTSGVLGRNDEEVSEACRVLLNSPQRLPSQIFLSSGFKSIDQIIHGSREDRVVAFEHFLKNASNLAEPNSELTAFMIGYLASRIAPGTIRHSSILNQVINQYPTALLWYGFCAGFSEDEDVMSNVGPRRSADFPPIARRIIRELFRPEPLLGAPFCDIGYLELIALSRTIKTPLEGIIKTTQGSAIVELLPGVCTSVNVLPKQSDRPQSKDLREKEVIASMGKQIERLWETYKSLFNGISPNGKDEQLSLFPSRRK